MASKDPKSRMLEFRVNNLEMAVNEIKEAVKIIAENSSIVAKLEAHHEETRDALKRAFETISVNRDDYEKSCEKVDERLRSVELQMPILKMTSRWIIAGVICVVSAAFSTLAVALWALLSIVAKGG